MRKAPWLSAVTAILALSSATVPTAQTTPSTELFTRAFDAGGLLPSSARRYAAIEEARLMQLVDEFIDISRRYRDNGHPQFWGRIMGTESDVESAEWLMDKFRQTGLTDIRNQVLDLPPQWLPQSWSVAASAGGRSLERGDRTPHVPQPSDSPRRSRPRRRVCRAWTRRGPGAGSRCAGQGGPLCDR